MILFKVNGESLNIRNPSDNNIEINGITSAAERTDAGNLITLNKVNSIAKMTIRWNYLTVAEMEELCRVFNINVADVDQKYPVKSIEQLVYKITTRLPCGIKTFSAYVGDSISATLVDNSGNEANNIGGEYWSNVSLALVGLGEQWNVSV